MVTLTASAGMLREIRAHFVIGGLVSRMDTRTRTSP